MSLTIIVSPYHITTRETPALAALLLADRVVTLLPTPHTGSGRENIGQAVERSPRYLRFMESWRWSMPLWREGVISASWKGEPVAAELLGLYEHVDADDALAPLRPLLRNRAGEDPEDFLDLLSADILKGGPDPAVSIPIAAALDRFGARHHLPVARSAAASVAQKAESRLGKRLLAFAVPVLMQASGRRLLALREKLAKPLAPLRRALAEPRRRSDLPEAAKDYTDAFETLAENLTRGDDEEGRRILSGFVSITAAELPADIVLRSSLAAARAVGARGSPSGEAPPPPDPGCLTALVIKPMSVRPDRRGPSASIA